MDLRRKTTLTRINNRWWLTGIVALGLLITGCSRNNKQDKDSGKANQELIIFHAGSLSVPFKMMAEDFERENPGVKVILEADGSRKCARKITDLKKECDVMASADYRVIDELLIPDYATWNIKFASNEMAIVYHDQSRYAKEINSENWIEILAREDVVYGRSDPNSDPCGYRAELVCKLAEKYYGQDGFADALLAKDVNYIRPKETDLIGLLEVNAIDYIFLYRSVAEQHELPFVKLPDSINLKIPEFTDFYGSVSTEITGKAPGEKSTQIGEPMVYGVTIPTKAPNQELAMKFVLFLLDDQKGLAIMKKNGQPDVVPAYSETFENIPAELQKFARGEK